MLFSRVILLIVIIICAYLLIGLVTTYIYRKLNPLKKLDRSSKDIYLTFDDGINKKFTPELLDLLKKYNVKVSFFILASTIEGNEEILQRMKSEGHLVGFHSYNHKNQILQLPNEIISDFKKCIGIFSDFKVHTRFYRPPWGHVRLLGLLLCRIYGIKIVLWNVIVQDWQGDTTVDIIFEKLRNKVKGNSVICLHDGRGKNSAPSRTIETLDKIIPLWKEEGYNFETVDKLS